MDQQQSAARGTPDNASSVSKLPPIPCNIKIVYGDTDLNIIIRRIGVCFKIIYELERVIDSPHVSSQFQQYIDTVKAGMEDGGDYQGAWEEIHRLQEPFQELMTKLAPIPRGQNFTLFDYLYVPYLVFEATAGHDGSNIEPRFKGSLPRQCYTPPGLYCSWFHGEEWLNLGVDRNIYFKSNPFGDRLRRPPPPVYPRTVESPRKRWHFMLLQATRIRRVSAHKVGARFLGLVHVSTEELARWEGLDLELYDSNPEMIPDYDEQKKCWSHRIVGILLNYIENRGTLYELPPWSDCSDEQRDQWALELESHVEELHAAGLVWGDAKPQNVLVDKENRLWLIDFDGGYTEGWIDRDLKETSQGDSQGVGRIKEWLNKCSDKPLVRVVRHG
ncbi:hypothetical protein LZ554_007396 [Drepanopeziza brunnea f. sp. 'monogermtubi']|nr:hypothetical protein LZ554_007396 [Drepanopeziza brunnea f. sp. 'monogermtubi']